MINWWPFRQRDAQLEFGWKIKERPKTIVDSDMFLREGMVEKIMDIKDMKNEYELAERLKITRGYLSMIRQQKRPISSKVQARIMFLLGSQEESILFIAREVEVENTAHQKYNYEKYSGRMPYEQYSAAEELRKRDPKEF